jgi:hypothetical protein
MDSAEANYQGVWGNRIGFGQRPALLVVDFLKAYTEEGSPLYAPGVVEAVANAPALLDAARKAGIPVIHTRILYLAKNCADGGMWVKKAPVMKAMVEGNVLAEFCEGVEPAAGELVVVTHRASTRSCLPDARRAAASAPVQWMPSSTASARSSCATASATAIQTRTTPISSISTVSTATSSRARRQSPPSYRRRHVSSLLKQRYEPEQDSQPEDR